MWPPSNLSGSLGLVGCDDGGGLVSPTQLFQAHHGLGERELLLGLQKAESIALGLATEAVVELLIGVDHEGGVLVVVPGAKGREVSAHGLQVDSVGADKFAEIDACLQRLDILAGKVVHGCSLKSCKKFLAQKFKNILQLNCISNQS